MQKKSVSTCKKHLKKTLYIVSETTDSTDLFSPHKAHALERQKNSPWCAQKCLVSDQEPHKIQICF